MAPKQHKSTQNFPWSSVLNFKDPGDGNAIIAPSEATTGHDDGEQVSGAGRVPTASINGHAVLVVSEGVSIDGNVVTAEAAPIIISGTAISVDSFHKVYIAGTPYQVPTLGHAPMTAMRDESVTVPPGNGFGPQSTVSRIERPANNVLLIHFSLDASSSQVADNDKDLSPTSAASDPLEVDANTSMTSQRQATPVSAATVEKDVTLVQGAPAVTMNGVPVSFGSAGEVVIGSKTMALMSSDGGLGGLIVGGLEGRPTSSGDRASSTPRPGANGSPSKNRTTPSRAVCTTSQLSWPMLAGSFAILILTAWL